MVVGRAVIAPRAVPVAGRTLVQVPAIALTQGRNIGIAAQEVSAGLLTYREAFLGFLCGLHCGVFLQVGEFGCGEAGMA